MQIPPISALRNFAGQLERRTEALPDDEAARKKLAQAWFRLGNKMSEAGHVEDGLACYRKALQLAPIDLELHYDLLFKLERLNRIDEAWQALQALELVTGFPSGASKKLHLLKARLEYRRGNLETSRVMLEHFLAETPVHTHRYLACGWLGTVLDELGHYDAAMDAFDAKNAALSNTPAAIEFLRANDAELEAIEASRRWYGKRPSFGWPDAATPDDSPILLVGFPRSGTTLLDQLLDAHPALSVIEEMPTLNGISKRFVGSADKLAALLHLGDAEADACRLLYRANVSDLLGRAPGESRIVDKLPLNIMHLDIYARLFPGAKIIVALRDPRDVVLSNYMQLYQLNPAMAANLSLERCTRYYAEVMGLYLRFREFMPHNIHEVRYESLVHDLEAEGKRLMHFLGLDWEEECLHFQETARRRRIATPSYHQVVKPVYRSAAGRWQNYRAHLEHILPLLQPCIEAFGY